MYAFFNGNIVGDAREMVLYSVEMLWQDYQSLSCTHSLLQFATIWLNTGFLKILCILPL